MTIITLLSYNKDDYNTILIYICILLLYYINYYCTIFIYSNISFLKSYITYIIINMMILIFLFSIINIIIIIQKCLWIYFK